MYIYNYIVQLENTHIHIRACYLIQQYKDKDSISFCVAITYNQALGHICMWGISPLVTYKGGSQKPL